jgi:Asp-tRNA(Asn)/Glu-tRNA(Gln) amidotransferase C subunit
MLARRCLRRPPKGLSVPRLPPRRLTSSVQHRTVETDSCGIPLQSTWSVNDLLTSYPSPTISKNTFKHLHKLSALIPPEEGTPEYDTLKGELEDLVKLVEAVKLVEVEEQEIVSDRDSRISADGTGIPLSDSEVEDQKSVRGSALLRYATRTSEGFYVVDTDRIR